MKVKIHNQMVMIEYVRFGFSGYDLVNKFIICQHKDGDLSIQTVDHDRNPIMVKTETVYAKLFFRNDHWDIIYNHIGFGNTNIGRIKKST